MMSIAEIENEIREEFCLLENWEDRYNFIIDMGKELPLIHPALKTDAKQIKGCQSRVWLHADYKDGLVHFTADSDAIITKGIISLLIRALSGHTPEDISESQVSFVDDIGLKEHLSPTRSNGLVSMINYMKHYASQYSPSKS